MSEVQREQSSFIVVLAAEAAARFQQGEEPLVVSNFPTPIGAATVTYRTRFADEGHEANVPREMWIDVQGEGSGSLDDAINAYAQAGELVPRGDRTCDQRVRRGCSTEDRVRRDRPT